MRTFNFNGLKLRTRWLPPGKYALPPFKRYWMAFHVEDDITPPYPQVTLERGVWVTDPIPVPAQSLVEQRLKVEALLARVGKGWRVISDVEYRLLANWDDFYSVKHHIKATPPPPRTVPVVIPHPLRLVPAPYSHVKLNMWWGYASGLTPCRDTVLVRKYGSRIKAGVPQFNEEPLRNSRRIHDWRLIHHGLTANPEYAEEYREFTYYMYRNGISPVTFWDTPPGPGWTHLVYTPE